MQHRVLAPAAAWHTCVARALSQLFTVVPPVVHPCTYIPIPDASATHAPPLAPPASLQYAGRGPTVGGEPGRTPRRQCPRMHRCPARKAPVHLRCHARQRPTPSSPDFTIRVATRHPAARLLPDHPRHLCLPSQITPESKINQIPERSMYTILVLYLPDYLKYISQTQTHRPRFLVQYPVALPPHPCALNFTLAVNHTTAHHLYPPPTMQPHINSLYSSNSLIIRHPYL